MHAEEMKVLSGNNSSKLGDVLMSYWENIMGQPSTKANSSLGFPPNFTAQELLGLYSSQFSKQDLVDLQFFSTLYKFVVPLAFAFIILVGLVGNVLVVVITLSAPDLRSTVNLLLVNLAISDISFLVLCVPINTYHFAASRWDIGDFACRLHHYVLYVSLYSTSYTHVLIALVRYLHIVHARRMMRLERYTKPTLAVVWIIILVFNIPILLIYRVNKLDMYAYCGTKDSEENGLYLIVSFFVLSYFLPLSFISVLYLLVARHVRRKQRMAKNRKRHLAFAKVLGDSAHVHPTARKEGSEGLRDQQQETQRGNIKVTEDNALDWLPEETTANSSRDLKETNCTSVMLASPPRLDLDTKMSTSGKSGTVTTSGNLKFDCDQIKATSVGEISHCGVDECKRASSIVPNELAGPKQAANDPKTFRAKLSSTGMENRGEVRKIMNRKRSSHVTKLCFLVVLVFGVSWLPLQLYLLMAYCGFKPQNKWYQAYRPLCHVMAYSNASVNPIIYHYVSRDFRQSLRRTITKFRNWWKPGN